MRDDERDEAVRSHIEALDAEIARLRKMEQALDRRLAERDAAPEPADERSGDEPER